MLCNTLSSYSSHLCKLIFKCFFMKMQTKKVALLLSLFNAVLVFSQVVNDTRDKLKIGFKAGVNYSNVYDEQGQNFVANGKTGFAAGAFVAIPIGSFFGIQPEIMYSQKGYKATGTALGFIYDYTRTTSYLDIPLLLQIKPIPMVSIVAGPQFSYLLDTKNSFNGNTTTSSEATVNVDNYKKNIFGFVTGADIEVDHFLVSARAGWDITKSDANGNSEAPRYKNQVLQLAIGYAF